ALEKLDGSQDETKGKAAAEAQRLLDALCALAIEFAAGDKVRAVAAAQPLDLVEQGWRTYLVKVCNPAHLTRSLRYDSPSAKPVPNAPPDAVENRWLQLAEYTGQPLLAALSGLDLEYRVLQVYTRDRGERTAEVRVWAGAATPNA